MARVEISSWQAPTQGSTLPGTWRWRCSRSRLQGRNPTRADSAGPVGAAEPQSERTIVGTYRQQRAQAEDAEYWANWKREQEAWRGWWGQGGWSRSADENWWSSHDWQRGWTRWQWWDEEEEEKEEEEVAATKQGLVEDGQGGETALSRETAA